MSSWKQSLLFELTDEVESIPLLQKQPKAFPSRAVLRERERELMYTPVPSEELPLKNSRLVPASYACMNAHQVRERTQRTCTESVLLCYMAQANSSEQLFRFFHKVKDASLDQLQNHSWLLKNNAPFRFKTAKDDRITPFFEFANQYGGVDQLAEDFLESPYAVREKLVSKVGGMGMKTASFWYYLLGGRNELVTLDQHVLEQAASLGVSMRSSLVNPLPRKSGLYEGQPVRNSPSKQEYLSIEEDLQKLFAHYSLGSRKVHDAYEGNTDTSLWFTTLWLAGIHEDRRQRFGHVPVLTDLFGDSRFIYPYTQ